MSFPNLERYPYVCVDVETTGLKWWEDKIFGVAISTPDGRDYYYDIRKQPESINWMKSEFPKIKKVVNHNIKFDIHFLRELGAVFKGQVWCTMISAGLINEHETSFSLDYLAKKYLGEGKDGDIYLELKKLFGGLGTRNVQVKNFPKAPVELIGKYAKKDTRVALGLYEWQKSEIERQGLGKVHKLESDLFPVVMDMEVRGVRVDVDRAEEALRHLQVKIDKLQKELNSVAGFECNPQPSEHIKKLFSPSKNEKGIWVACDGTELKNTASGNASIDSEALSKMRHPAASIILSIRKMMKCRNTFIKGHILSHHHEGVIHPNINQTKGEGFGTGTGRFSYNQPALQQIPARDKDVAGIVRPMFVPDYGQVWGCWDYEQFEFRMFAHYINNQNINKMFNDDPDTDFHQAIADLTGLPRSAPSSGGANAKQLNLGMVFGMGGGLLAEKMGLPSKTKVVKFNDGKEKEILVAGPEAEEVIRQYHNTVPSIEQISRKAASIAKTRGYVRTLMDRHIRFPRGYFTHKAAGLIYQGSSADCMKQKLIELDKLLKGTEGRLLLSVHDEVNVSLPIGDEKMIRDITEVLECYDGVSCPIKLRIPIRTDFGQGSSWKEASGK